jgi:hypothetical protein
MKKYNRIRISTREKLESFTFVKKKLQKKRRERSTEISGQAASLDGRFAKE